MKIEQKTNKEIEIEDYYKPFLKQNTIESKRIELALERAWKNRDFEIDKYWSRATYFWAFIAATFAGYVTVANIKDPSTQLQDINFAIASLGFVFSFAWCLVNKGSKKWQENWEKHIDMLEDSVTGPLYKTVLNQTGYSVSKINLLVSQFVCIIWIILWVKALFPATANNSQLVFSWWKFIIALFTVYSIIVMLLKNDKTPQKKITFSFRRRDNEHNSHFGYLWKNEAE